MVCILCTQNPPIQNSHVIPKFVFKRLKLGSPLGTLRNSQNPNKVEQDGWKGDFLCDICEKTFGRLEDWFVKRIYDPFLQGKSESFEYDQRLGLFAASLHFRNYSLQTRSNPGKANPADLAFAEQLRQMCLMLHPQCAGIFSYIQLLTPVTDLKHFAPGVNTYFFEVADPRVEQFSDGRALSYVKFPNVLFVASNFDLSSVTTGFGSLQTHVIQAAGNYSVAGQSGALMFGAKEIAAHRIKEIHDNYREMSAQQLKKIQDKIDADPDKLQSRAHRTFELDQKLLAMQNAQAARVQQC